MQDDSEEQREHSAGLFLQAARLGRACVRGRKRPSGGCPICCGHSTHEYPHQITRRTRAAAQGREPGRAAPPASAAGDALERFGCSDDRDALIGLQVEQIRVARDDEIGLRGEGAGEHVVVIGIG